MLNHIIRFSLHNRLVVLIGALLLIGAGLYTTRTMEVDVFPDINAPTVVVMTEAGGMAPEEVERLVTFPLETALNGTTHLRRVRSASTTGFSVVWAEFDWGTDIYKARQLVTERISALASDLPANVGSPTLGPQSSILGEMMIVALTADSTSMQELRTLADWTLRPRLLATGGVAQVAVLGGDIKEYQILLHPEKMAHYGVQWEEVLAAVQEMNRNVSGGVLYEYGSEYIIRGLLATSRIEALASAWIKDSPDGPITLAHIAQVRIGAQEPRLGTASTRGKPAVLVTVTKQPRANTQALTRRLDTALDEMATELPPDVQMHRDIFRQSHFIENAIGNVKKALLEGGLFVVLVLFLFLMNVRTTFISLVSIPVSVLVAILLMRALGITVNTMTLGGLAIAIGSLVDDAIVDVENVYKRLREHHARPATDRASTLETVLKASQEVRMPILNSTLIIVVCFAPLFFLSGMEGRMLEPLGVAFILALCASTLVALTLTPVLCSLLLPASLRKSKCIADVPATDKSIADKPFADNPAADKPSANSTSAQNPSANITSVKNAPEEAWLTRTLKGAYRRVLGATLRHKGPVMTTAFVLFSLALGLFLTFGRGFLPPFNEGSFTVNVSTLPGVSLEESDHVGRMAEQLLLTVPEIRTVGRKTGRAELDEHALGINTSEIEAPFVLDKRSKAEVAAEIRAKLKQIPGVAVEVGAPISHRIDAMLSGTRANIAIKLFGPDLPTLYRLGNQIKEALASLDNIADLNVEQQVTRPQLQVVPRREMLARYGLSLPAFGEQIEILLGGRPVSQVYEGNRNFDLCLRVDSTHRASAQEIRNLMIPTAQGPVPLGLLAQVETSMGPNTINREDVMRKMVVSANVTGGDLTGAVRDIRQRIAEQVELPEDYHIAYGGQFESEQRASRTILVVSLFAILAIFMLLYNEFKSAPQALVILVNLPLALIGGVFSIGLTGGVVSIPAIIGFISLFGIATRNGMLLVERYNQLMQSGLSVHESVVQGSLDRLNPILMTALTSALALIPLALGGQLPGNEIQSPMAKVILGGLLSSTLLNALVVPILYTWLHRKQTA